LNSLTKTERREPRIDPGIYNPATQPLSGRDLDALLATYRGWELEQLEEDEANKAVEFAQVMLYRIVQYVDTREHRRVRRTDPIHRPGQGGGPVPSRCRLPVMLRQLFQPARELKVWSALGQNGPDMDAFRTQYRPWAAATTSSNA
jgi:hypothetical protein